MRHNHPGDTGVCISELAFGTMTFGDEQYANVCTVLQSVASRPTGRSSVASQQGENRKLPMLLTFDGTNT